MPRIIIGSKVIEFPSSGTDANWAPAVTDFALAVESEFAGLISAFDVSPRVQTLPINPIVGSSLDIDVENCNFPNEQVRGIFFTYTIYRESTGVGATSVDEIGYVNAVYNTVTGDWNYNHYFNGVKQNNGSAWHEFFMSGDQLVLRVWGISGVYNDVDSKISYSAKTLLVDNL
jgi:hypothetical protein